MNLQENNQQKLTFPFSKEEVEKNKEEELFNLMFKNKRLIKKANEKKYFKLKRSNK